MSGKIQRHARVLSVLLAARSAYAAPAPEAGQGRLIQQARSGFFVLWTEFRRSERGSPKVFVAQNRAQLAELWREFDVDVQPPKMNFGKWLVVAQQIPVACSLDRPHELLLSASARLEVLPEPRSGLVGCTDVARESIAVIAVARDALALARAVPSRSPSGCDDREAIPRPTERLGEHCWAARSKRPVAACSRWSQR